MREAVGNTFIFYFIIIFTSIFVVFSVGSISYSKAFRVKNLIIDSIENNGGWNDNVPDEISNSLSQVGYKVGNPPCPDVKDINSEDDENLNITRISNTSNYYYCLYEMDRKNSSGYSQGKYYKVIAYIYFDFPVVGDFIQFPVSGETKFIYDAPEPR